MLKSLVIILTGIGCLVLPCTAHASTTEFLHLDTREDFAAGEVKGLAISGDGRLYLAPELTVLSETNQPYILSAAADNSGAVYFGTGHDGKVFRMDDQGELQLYFDAEDPDIFALAVDSGGVLYVGTSPGAKIFKVTQALKSELVAEIPARYIWDLAVEKDGSLLAATGIEGKLFRVTGTESEVLFDSSQIHLMCLATEGEGSVLVGTAPNGYLIRVSQQGQAQSLLDTPHQEIHELVIDRLGRIYILGIGKEQDVKSEDSAVTESVEAISQILNNKNEKTEQKTANSGGVQVLDVSGSAESRLASVYRLNRDSGMDTVWFSRQHTAFSMVVAPDGTIYLGTNDKGRILAISQDRQIATVAESGQEQITRMLWSKNGVTAFSSNIGRTYRIGPKPASSGEFISDVLDMKDMSQLGMANIVTNGLSDPSKCLLMCRGGNTARPDNTWSKWNEPVTAPGGPIILKPARYFQVKLVLEEGTGSGLSASGTWIESVSVSFLRRNRSPRMLSITVNPPGIVYQPSSQNTSPTGLPQFGAQSTFQLPGYITEAFAGSMTQVPRNMIYSRGSLSLTWKAWDADEDVLNYQIFLRRREDTFWTLVGSRLREPYLVLSHDELSDGHYIFKVVTDDGPSNAEDRKKSDELTSKPVVKDSTPPRISRIAVSRAADSLQVVFQIQDSLSPVYAVEYSINGGDNWMPAFAKDNLFDELEEDVELLIPVPETRIRQIWLRAMDNAGNIGTADASLPQEKDN